MTLNPEQQALIKQAWLDIQNNPQDHGSVFFMGYVDHMVQTRFIIFYSGFKSLPKSF